MNIAQKIIAIATVIFLTACQGVPNREKTLFDDLGGQAGIDTIVDNFITDIQQYSAISAHFEDSNMTRFRSKISEHLCHVSGGPCEYTGDTMLQVHQGMNVNEAKFNQVVEIMIDAMDEADIAIGVRNRLLAVLAPMRADIIYQ